MNLIWAIVKTVLKLESFGTNPANNGEITFNGTKFLAKEGGTVKDLIANAQSQGDLTAGLTAKGTPVDADMFPIADSAASNIWKKVTGAVMKTFINYLTKNGNDLGFTGGKFGIGTTSPGQLLEIIGFLTNNSQFRMAGLEFQSYAINNAFIGDNIYYNGGFKHRANGKAGLFYFLGDEGQFRFGANANAGDTATNISSYCSLKTNIDGSFAVGPQLSSTNANYSNYKFKVDGSGNGIFTGSIETGGVMKLKSYTFSTLPGSPQAGWRAYISDGAASPTWGGNAAGGGSIKIPVFYDGTNWVYR